MSVENITVLGIVGSPRKDGLTFRHVNRALEGAEKAGATTELVQMSDYLIETCQDCMPWICRENLRCTYDDESFEELAEKILNCDGLILGTPVYCTEPSAQIKLLMNKMNRVFWVSKMNGTSGRGWGLPALGIAVAGGSGKGMLTAIFPLYQFFRTWRFRAVTPLPVTQFNLEETAKRAEEYGHKVAEMARNPQAFESWSECQCWYDSLPYFGEPLSVERKLLASIISQAIPDDKKNEIKGNMSKSARLESEGDMLGSIAEISDICDSGAQIFAKLHANPAD